MNYLWGVVARAIKENYNVSQSLMQQQLVVSSNPVATFQEYTVTQKKTFARGVSESSFPYNLVEPIGCLPCVVILVKQVLRLIIYIVNNKNYALQYQLINAKKILQ